MDNVSKVIFTCLAIGYTFLIYQNNSLKDDIETLKGYAQLDTDKAWERLDKIEAEQTRIKGRVGGNEISITNLYELTSIMLDSPVTN